MRLQRLTNQKIICIINDKVFISTYKNGNKNVTIIISPKVTQVITYKTEKDQYLDTFKRIKRMTAKKDCDFKIVKEEMWKYYKYYAED